MQHVFHLKVLDAKSFNLALADAVSCLTRFQSSGLDRFVFVGVDGDSAAVRILERVFLWLAYRVWIVLSLNFDWMVALVKCIQGGWIFLQSLASFDIPIPTLKLFLVSIKNRH